MGERKTREEWVELFLKYETQEWDWNKYYKLVSFTDKAAGKRTGMNNKYANARKLFKRKYKLWKKLDNSFMNNKIETRGRKTKLNKKERREKFEKALEDISKDDLKEIAKRYYEITEDKDKSAYVTEISEINLSASKLEKIFDVCRQTISKRKKGIVPKKTRSCKTEKYYNLILDEFRKSRENYGKVRLSAIIMNVYGVYIPESTILYSMHKLALSCKVRKARKKREVKNTSVEYIDLVLRGYNRSDVYSTDVKYLRCKGLSNNFGYLSIAINHRTKKVDGFAFSETNGLDFVLETYKQLDLNGKIMHSDHGWQYSHADTVKYCKENNCRISMGRIGVCLDNREAEYFFSNLESECLQKLKLHLMSFEEVKKAVTEYIYWYNNVRIQSILEWKTPAEADVQVVNY